MLLDMAASDLLSNPLQLVYYREYIEAIAYMVLISTTFLLLN